MEGTPAARALGRTRRQQPAGRCCACVAVLRFPVAAVPAEGGRVGMEDEDFLLALRLQREWEEQDKVAAAAAKRPDVSSYRSSLRPLSVVDEAWELLDPSPDVHGLFVHFNQTLFWGKLEAVTVSWSPRMTRYGIGGCGAELPALPCPGAVARPGRQADPRVSGAVWERREGSAPVEPQRVAASVGEELSLVIVLLLAVPRQRLLVPWLLFPGTWMFRISGRARTAGQELVAVVVSLALHLPSLAAISGFPRGAGKPEGC